MIGAVAGDIIGSVYEGYPIKTKNFPLFSPRCTFTDDTVLSVAIAKAIMCGEDYCSAVKAIGRRYPDCGYGRSFFHWLFSDSSQPYNSWGNGSAMRVSPVGYAFDSEDQVLSEAEKTAKITHNHPEGIKGAQATALAVFLARSERDKDLMKKEIQQRFGYNLNRALDDIRPAYHFDISCQGSVPESIIAFLESADFESAVRNAVSLGGDSDTMSCIAGAIAQAYYKNIPEHILLNVRQRLPEEFLGIIDEFNEKFPL